MPQLEIGDFAPQVVWLVITFVSLYLISWKLILPRIGDVLDAREERITDDLEEAGKLKKAAEDALSTYEAALADARTKAHGMAAETHAALMAEAAKRNEALQEKLAAEAADADSRIAAARAEAVSEIRTVARDTARAVTARLIGVEVPEDAAKAAVDAAFGGGA